MMQGIIWNTSYHITYDSKQIYDDSILNTLSKVGSSLSIFDTTSVVSKVNAMRECKVDDDFIKVYNASRIIHDRSNGAFDPTISPLVTAWGFGKGHTATADTANIDNILQYVGIKKTHLSGDSIIKQDTRTEFNFSAIAKGYGCDAVGDMFKRNGINNFIIEIGGEICVSGKSPRGDKWIVSVDKPIETTDDEIHTSECTIQLSDCGMATSGNYRNFHTEGGNKYGHTINTKTGRPAKSDILSATIIDSTCMMADGYATACMAMGAEESKKLITKYNLPAMLILADGSVWESEAFKKLIVK
jgi:thiamine biosynthesis lipoprotein